MVVDDEVGGHAPAGCKRQRLAGRRHYALRHDLRIGFLETTDMEPTPHPIGQFAIVLRIRPVRRKLPAYGVDMEPPAVSAAAMDQEDSRVVTTQDGVADGFRHRASQLAIPDGAEAIEDLLMRGDRPAFGSEVLRESQCNCFHTATLPLCGKSSRRSR